MTEGKPYFTISGSESEGWRIMLYRYVIERTIDRNDQPVEKLLDSVSPCWLQPKEFPTLQLALAELLEHESIDV